MGVPTKWFLENYEKMCAEIKMKMDERHWQEGKNRIARPCAEELGWYDWFCNESALIGRTVKYGGLIRSIVKAVPILGRNTMVSFSQTYGDGYVDYFGIYAPVRNNKFGYVMRVDKRGYYVYREGRWHGADFTTERFSEVVRFIQRDVAMWLLGAQTREYKAIGRSYSGNDYGESRIKASKVIDLTKTTPANKVYTEMYQKLKKKSKEVC